MVMVIAIEEGEIKIRERAIDYAATFANRVFSCLVAITTKTGLAVKNRRVREVFPVKAPIPVPERTVILWIFCYIIYL